MVVWYFPTWNNTLLLNKKKKEKSIICAAQKYIGQIALSPSLKKGDLLHILRPLVELIN